MNGREENEEVGYGLVMPFVVCQSNGGPYEDKAFVAGARYAFVETMLRMLGEFGVGECEQYVETALVSQLDLVAMRHGWKMTAEPWEEHPDEWTLVKFERADGGGDGRF